MKKFQELKIKTLGSPEQAIEEIAKILPNSWSRDKDREADLTVRLGNANYCFEFKTATASHAMLFVSPLEGGLKVTNIVPMDKSQLTIDEYNCVLDAFIQEGINGNFKFEVTKSDVELSDIISVESVNKFKAFSGLANKSTGHSHPSDEARWFEFILSTVLSDEHISHDELTFFLREQGWDEGSAYDLALDYSYGFRAMRHALAGGVQ